jgi:N-acetylmuramoyl-L-alanine amidase
MTKIVTVGTGDCFINISKQEGFFWETVWGHPENSNLRQQRKHYNIIKAGDEIYIPDLTTKTVSRETEKEHLFRIKGKPTYFTLTLLSLGQPRANENYILTVDGESRRGCTDENGTLRERIPAKARYGLLLLGEDQEEITINFGYIDPIDEVSGVQRRLQNLGFYEGEIDGELNEDTVAGIAEFQRSVEISGEGELTDETRQRLVEANGD